MTTARALLRAVLAAAIVPATLPAQDPPDTARLEPVVSTATRVPVPQAAAPAAVTVITGEELRARGITHVADALRDVTGVALAQSGSAGSPTALFMRGGESKYVKVLVDGVPVNEAGGAFDFGTITTQNVERVEIVRGPVSVLYGSDAVTGVVQIFTRRGTGRPSVRASARAGTHQTFDNEVTFGGAAGPATYSFGVSSFRTAGSYPFNSAYRNDGLSGLVRLAPDARTDARLSVRYSDNRVNFPTTGSGLPADSNQFRSQDRLVFGLEVGRFFTPRIEGRLTLASNASDVDGANDPDSPGDSLEFYFTSIGAARRRSADAQITAAFAAPLWLTVGAQAEEQRETSFSQGRSRFGPSNSSFRAARRNRAAYTQLLLRASEVASATAGVRYDHSETFGGFPTYRLAANVRVLPGTRLRLAMGTAFREPLFFENFSTGFTVGNPDLRPERTASWELGGTHELAGIATVSATYFAQRFTNMIDYTFSPPDAGAPNYYNIARASSTGVELEGRAGLTGDLSLDIAYTRLWTRVLDPGFDVTQGALLVRGARLLRRPTHSASAGVTYQVRDRASADLRVQRVGDRDDRNYAGFPPAPARLGWYTRVDAAGQLRVLPPHGSTPGASLSVRVENLTDQAYQTVYGFDAPGRSVLAGIRVDF